MPLQRIDLYHRSGMTRYGEDYAYPGGYIGRLFSLLEHNTTVRVLKAPMWKYVINRVHISRGTMTQLAKMLEVNTALREVIILTSLSHVEEVNRVAEALMVNTRLESFALECGNIGDTNSAQVDDVLKRNTTLRYFYISDPRRTFEIIRGDE